MDIVLITITFSMLGSLLAGLVVPPLADRYFERQSHKEDERRRLIREEAWKETQESMKKFKAWLGE